MGMKTKEIGAPNTRLILPNGFPQELEKICRVNTNSSLKEISLK